MTKKTEKLNGIGESLYHLSSHKVRSIEQTMFKDKIIDAELAFWAAVDTEATDKMSFNDLAWMLNFKPFSPWGEGNW